MPRSLIARRKLFGNPDRTMCRLSPDMRHLSWIAPDEGVLNVWVAPLDNLEAARVVTRDRSRGIRSYGWSWDAAWILYAQDKAGDENWRFHSVGLDGGPSRDLTPIDGVQARQIASSWRRPGEIIIGLNERDKAWHDLYRLDLASGERELILCNEGQWAAFTLDDEHRVRLVGRSLPDGGSEALLWNDGDTEPFITFGYEDALSSGIIGLEGGGESVLLVSSVGRDTAALCRMALKAGSEPVEIAASPIADVTGTLRHPKTRMLEAYAVTDLRNRWHAVGPAVRDDLAFLEGKLAGDPTIIRSTLADTHWVVASGGARDPGRYFLYDRAGRTLEPLFETRPELADAPLRSMHPFALPSRDGLRLTAYLTLPEHPGGEIDEDALPPRPASPPPMVLYVHGGPWSRDAYGFNPVHQWLADRGYAVLSVNFRGSTGFGKRFLNAGDGEWAGRMHDDLIDAVEWAVSNGYAARERIAIMGGSYGGYATLVGLTFTPEVFACGVDIVGPSNLETLLATVPPYWKSFYENMVRRIGDPRTADGLAFLRARSPVHKADMIVRPLLIGQGANDPRVKQAESDQIVTAMQAKGLAVTYMLFPDEGHGFARPENRLAFNAATEAFLARHLGGAFEPIGSDFDGARIEVPAGAGEVTGLAESLAAIANRGASSA
ncbi:MAG: prolyl oligopeptidase family serine peptidase [Rhizobiales bacterium]|nr:prolyl oligopeptidase family serine peptidase [Hyphomicrobiales bacterium]